MQSGAERDTAISHRADGMPDHDRCKSIGSGISGKGVAVRVGDYDNDGFPDLALALEDRVAVFHNLGHGKFADTTSALGIRSLNHPAGLTFVDFDHDGDLDLFITGRRFGREWVPMFSGAITGTPHSRNGPVLLVLLARAAERGACCRT